ncbi:MULTISPECIES: YihY family inner membrane protein [Pseudomonadaceae]|uniref:YihY family inner membrane protein n=1 Tax=Pseudomonadaceae TaxID=135621 RepID=UPI00084B4C24|nr:MULTISPECIES: YihY family inner membrane protein [Pseudomonas]OEC55710.1 hypothetical protein A9G05_17665 [Pseudomonas sp. ENNP23]
MRQRIRDIEEFWRFLLQRFISDNGFNSAAALTYTSLFAVVPIMTVTFTMLSVIPAFQGMGEQIQRFIFHNFVPSTGEAVQEYLQGFTLQARHLTWVGVGLLAITAFTMLVTIEKAFNTIWRVRQRRRGMASFLLYWAVLSLGPLLLGAGFAVSTYITSLALLSSLNEIAGTRALLGFTPLLFNVAAFTLLYAAVPNVRVPLRHAVVGGAFTALLFELAKALFGLYVSLFPGYQLIYGAFATVPLFLLWVYVSWVIVLFGAELVCNLGHSRHWRRQALPRLLVVLGILRVMHDRQQRGLPARRLDAQRAGWLLPEDEWLELMDFLEAQHLACPVAAGAWVLCRDLSNYSLHQLLNHCPWPLPKPAQLPAHLDEPWYPALKVALERLQEDQQALFDKSLASWLRPVEE